MSVMTTTPATITVRPKPLLTTVLAYTTESEGYAFVPATPSSDNAPDYGCEPYDPTGPAEPWLPTAAEVGLEWTPPLRRATLIDPLDPTEALDTQEPFVGMHLA